MQNLYQLYNIFLKQMTLKYLHRAVLLLLWVLAFSSCLNSSESEFEFSHDAQIYSFSMESKKDTTKVLPGVKFTIDQLNNLIFNQDSLPYLFDVDSISLKVSGKTSYSFSKIVINLQNGDSTYLWNGEDSVAFKRLESIETTAEDGITTRKYRIKVNIHQQNPNLLNWSRITQNHLIGPVESQKSILHEGKFITYYKSGDMIKASTSPSTNGKEWTPVTVSGLPATIRVNTLLSATNGNTSTIYALDADSTVYSSTDGLIWNRINSGYPVVAIYGILPSLSGEMAVLTAINDEGILKFALTNDFVSFSLKEALPADDTFPVADFTSTSMENPAVHSAKYIILAGRKDNILWIIQEKEGKITLLSETSTVPLQVSQLFVYDAKVYLMTYETGKNRLYYSERYGLDWISAGTEQELPDTFTGRIGASVITDSNNFIWIFGGESGAQVPIADVWRGRLNKLAK